MIIPSIDLMDGKAVQLRQGKDHVLTSERCPVELAREFNRYGEVAVIDLDAARGLGSNLDLVRKICKVADVRAGGGVRDADKARELLRAGASRIIMGTAAEPELLAQFPPRKVMVALDHKGGRVLDRGWTRDTGESLTERAVRLAPFCGSFLCTFVEGEGGMGGMDFSEVEAIRDELPLPVTVAGGVADTREVIALSRRGFDVQVGMALYTGKIDPVRAVVDSVDFQKNPLVPTIAQDEGGKVLMLAYSTAESLHAALGGGVGTYFSRSRNELWEKGATSGNRQQLISCRVD
ncbi:MAG: HisA/HisF-related TIM barrel protein, partial [Planctomycetota bacterium]